MNFLRTSFLFLFSILLLNACKTKQNLVKNQAQTQEKSRFVAKYDSTRLNFQRLEIAFNADFDDTNQSLAFGGKLRILHDSIIWASLSPGLGIELARIMLTPDSAKMINRMNKTYFTESFAAFNKKFGIELDFFAIQAVLLNQIFSFPYNQEAWHKKMTYQSDSGKVFLSEIIESEKDPRENIALKFELDFQAKLLKSMLLQEDFARSITIAYSNFEPLAGNPFPKKLQIAVLNHQKKILFSCFYKRFELNKSLRFSFQIPQRYKKTEWKKQ